MSYQKPPGNTRKENGQPSLYGNAERAPFGPFYSPLEVGPQTEKK
jgi:hypothetical protein